MNLNDPIFHDEAKARAYFEAIRWPDGPYCAHCGETEKVYRLEGRSHRPGLIHCNSCNGSFTVTTGGVMESSHIPLTKWALGFMLYAASKKGFSAHQLHRQLGITYKSAWFMSHRIREAMAPTKSEPPLGGAGKVVEADEMFLAKSKKTKTRGTHRSAKAVLTLVERGGRVRSVPFDGQPNRSQVRDALHKHVNWKSTLHTDGSPIYDYTAAVREHESVDHDKQYARKGKKHKIHTNSAEGYISVFKRGMIGTYQHCEEQHLQRYLNEFDFRQSNRAALGVDDTERTARAVKGAVGKRLTYRNPFGLEGAQVPEGSS